MCSICRVGYACIWCAYVCDMVWCILVVYVHVCVHIWGYDYEHALDSLPVESSSLSLCYV